MEDVAGDIARTTVPKVHGMAAASALARASVGAAIALSLTPFLWYLAPSSWAGVALRRGRPPAGGVFIVSVAWLPHRLRLEQTVSKGAMALALGAFLAVAFR